MNKKNTVVIAIILLLLIGTGSFVFAGSSEEKLEERNTGNNENNNTNRTEKKDEVTVPTIKEEDLNSETSEDGMLNIIPSDNTEELNNGNNNTNNNQWYTGSNNQNNTQNQNTGGNQTTNPGTNTPTTPSNPIVPETPVIDETAKYEELESLIKNMETTYAKDDLERAEEILNTLKDSEKKNEIAEKLNEIKTTIEIESQIKQLETMLQNASKKEDINEIRDIKNNLNLTEESIPNNNKKEELTDALREINKVLNDNSDPIINGIENDAITNQDVSITIEEEAIKKITLNNKEVTEEELKEIKAEGEYKLIVIDQAYNKTEIVFTIDKTAPTAQVNYSQTELTNQSVTATLVNESEEIKIINNNGSKEYTFEENGEFTFEIEDRAGNKAFIKAEVNNIDKEAPERLSFGIIKISEYGGNSITKMAEPNDEIAVYVTFDEKLKENPTITINGNELSSELETTYSTEEKFVYLTKYVLPEDSAEGNVEVLISNYQDMLGNIGQTLTNNEINDPIYNSIYVLKELGFIFEEDKVFNTREIVINDPNYLYMEIDNWDDGVITEEHSNRYTIPANTVYTFTIHYQDGSSKSFTMTFDDQAPEITAKGTIGSKTEKIKENEIYDKVKLEINDPNLSMIKRVTENGEEIIEKFENYETEKNYEFTESGNYHIIVIDKAGNETVVKFQIG